MISLEDYKKALGSAADGLTDAQLERMNTLSERAADALFSKWGKQLTLPFDNQKPQ